MDHYDQIYADAPRTITEIRSDKTGNSKDWTPRDALISILRDIDSGAIAVEQVVIVFATKEGDAAWKTRARCAGKFSTYECMGLVSDTLWRMHNDGG